MINQSRRRFIALAIVIVLMVALAQSMTLAQTPGEATVATGETEVPRPVWETPPSWAIRLPSAAVGLGERAVVLVRAASGPRRRCVNKSQAAFKLPHHPGSRQCRAAARSRVLLSRPTDVYGNMVKSVLA